MDHTTLHMGQKDEVRRIIIGAPLLLVAVFCFGFFMIHPAGSSEVHSTSSSSSSSSETTHKKTPATSTSSLNELAPLPMAKTDLSSLPRRHHLAAPLLRRSPPTALQTSTPVPRLVLLRDMWILTQVATSAAFYKQSSTAHSANLGRRVRVSLAPFFYTTVVAAE